MTIFHTGTLVHAEARRRAIQAVQNAPEGYVVRIEEPKRNLDQNAALWPRLSLISKAKPNGRVQTPEQWKAIMMRGAGVGNIRYLNGLDGEPFPIGYMSSKLSKSDFSALLEFIDWFITDSRIKDTYEPEHKSA